MRFFLKKQLNWSLLSRFILNINPHSSILLNQPLSNLYHNINLYNNIYPSYYSVIANYDELEVFPSIGRPGPWIYNLEIPEIINLTEAGKNLKQDGYLSTDGGFFFPTSVFDLSRSRRILDRDVDRRMGSYHFKDPNTSVGEHPTISRATASITKLAFNEESRFNVDSSFFTQTLEDSNDILKTPNLYDLTKQNSSLKFKTLNKSHLSLIRNRGFNRTINWRKRNLIHKPVYGKKLNIKLNNNLTKLSSASFSNKSWLPKELQIPLLSIEPINLPLPFYQTVVRWKPSGSTWWRLYRRIFSYQLSRAPTQHREQLTQRAITRWVARCWRVLSFSSLKFWASTVASILERAGWEQSPSWVINQRAIENRLWQVYPGDVIQVRGLPGSRRVLSVAPISRLEPPRRALWVHWAPTIEIDELTYSVVIIHWGHSANVKTTTFPYLTHRLYNWKYRT